MLVILFSLPLGQGVPLPIAALTAAVKHKM
jgi:hypothetical protein